MESFSSRFRGTGFDEVHAGIEEHRAFNLARKTSKHQGGWETRYLTNKAIFTAAKAAEIPTERHDGENRFEFADRKVRSA